MHRHPTRSIPRAHDRNGLHWAPERGKREMTPTLPVVEGSVPARHPRPAARARRHAAAARVHGRARRRSRAACATASRRRVVLTGMGSSHLGLVPLHLRLVEAGLLPLTVESSELLHYQRALLDDGTLLVLVSQSGRSAEILRLLEAVRGRDVATLAVTNTAASPLAREATRRRAHPRGRGGDRHLQDLPRGADGARLAGRGAGGRRPRRRARRPRGDDPGRRRVPRVVAFARRVAGGAARRACARSTTRDAARRSPPPPPPASSRRSRRTGPPRA